MCIILGAVFVGVYPVYEAGNLPLFEIVFSRLDEKAQGEWLGEAVDDEKWRNC